MMSFGAKICFEGGEIRAACRRRRRRKYGEYTGFVSRASPTHWRHTADKRHGQRVAQRAQSEGAGGVAGDDDGVCLVRIDSRPDEEMMRADKNLVGLLTIGKQGIIRQMINADAPSPIWRSAFTTLNPR